MISGRFLSVGSIMAAVLVLAAFAFRGHVPSAGGRAQIVSDIVAGAVERFGPTGAALLVLLGGVALTLLYLRFGRG